MAAPAAARRFTFAEYLAVERSASTKHEFYAGRIFAMAGGTLEHARIAANLIAALGAQLRGRACTVFTSDARLRVLATGLATYPDVSVVCGAVERDPDSDETLTNHVVLVEVLSESTEGYDREEKFAHYRRIPSLREYVLVSQRERRVEHLSRNDDGSWTLRDMAPPAQVRLASIGCALTFDDVYGRQVPSVP